MTSARLAQLLVAHALAESEPLGAVLRSLPGIAARRAASAAEAGRLERALRLVDYPADLAQLALRWPAALRPALDRLTRLPPALLFQAPLLQVLGYFVVVAVLQLSAVLMLQTKVLPTLAVIPNSGLDPSASFFLVVAAGDVALTALAAALAIWATRAGPVGGRLLQWLRPLARAREASLAAALHDAEAPEDVRNAFLGSCKVLRGRLANRREFDLVIEQSMSRAEAAHQRFVTAVRVVGYAALTCFALVALLGIYQALARFAVLT